MRQKILLICFILLLVGFTVWGFTGFSLDFMKFFAAEPTPTDSPRVGPPLYPAGPVTCAPGTQTVHIGQKATISAVGGDARYEWFSPEGVPTGSGPNGATSYSVSYLTAGTKKVTVQSGRGDGSSAVDSVACTVVVDI